MSLNCSSTSAPRFLNKNTVAVGKSTICNLLKKHGPIINKNEVTIVCIDDFAIKRREKYGKLSVFKHEIDYLLVKGIIASKIEEIIRNYLYVGLHQQCDIMRLNGKKIQVCLK